MDMIEFSNILMDFLSAYHFCDFYQLVVIISTSEEWFSRKHHSSEHASR